MGWVLGRRTQAERGECRVTPAGYLRMTMNPAVLGPVVCMLVGQALDEAKDLPSWSSIQIPRPSLQCAPRNKRKDPSPGSSLWTHRTPSLGPRMNLLLPGNP